MFQDQLMHLIRSTRNYARGVIFWNVALDQNSSPKLNGVDPNGVNRGLITIRSDVNDDVKYESGYYSMGHFSKFVNPDAFVITSDSYQDYLESVAFINPDNTIVVVVSNRLKEPKNVKINWNNNYILFSLDSYETVTLKW